MVRRKTTLLGLWEDVDEGPLHELAGETLDLLHLELHLARYESEQRVVGTALDVLARMKLGSALTENDVAGFCRLAAEDLDAEALGDRITTEGG